MTLGAWHDDASLPVKGFFSNKLGESGSWFSSHRKVPCQSETVSFVNADKRLHHRYWWARIFKTRLCETERKECGIPRGQQAGDAASLHRHTGTQLTTLF